MGIEGMENLKPEPRKPLGMCDMKPHAYLIDRDASRSSLLRNKIPSWNGVEYEVILRKAENFSNIELWDRDIVIIGDPLGSDDIEIGIVRAATLKYKQLRLIGPRTYEVKPLQP